MLKETKDNCTVPWTKHNSRICQDPADVEKSFNISWYMGTNQVRTKDKSSKNCKASELAPLSECLTMWHIFILGLFCYLTVTIFPEPHLLLPMPEPICLSGRTKQIQTEQQDLAQTILRDPDNSIGGAVALHGQKSVCRNRRLRWSLVGLLFAQFG